VARADGAPVDLDDLDQAMQSQERLYEDVGRQAGQAVVRTDSGEVQIVFGHPKTRENDARRAVRLALRIAARSHAAAELLRLERGLAVAVHVALHCGLGIVRASAAARRARNGWTSSGRGGDLRAARGRAAPGRSSSRGDPCAAARRVRLRATRRRRGLSGARTGFARSASSANGHGARHLLACRGDPSSVVPADGG
jgi:hypothetical protein